MKPFEAKVKNPETGIESTIKFVEYTPTEGPGKDNPKIRPEDWDSWDLKRAISIWGEAKLWQVVNKSKLMQFFANFTNLATTKDDETPETDEAVVQKNYISYFTNLSLRGESLQALSRRLGEIEGEEMPRIVDMLLSPSKALTPDETVKLKKQYEALKVERADLKSDIERIKKSKRPQVTEDQEPEKKAA